MEGSTALGRAEVEWSRLEAEMLGVPLREREELWTRVTEAVERACRGSGSVVAVDAPSGHGKTAFLAAIGDLANEQGISMLGATGRERERESGLGVVLQLLEARIDSAGERERAMLLSGAASPAARLFVEGPRQGPREPSFALLHGLYHLCAKLAELQPSALMVDNADLADDASLRFLIYLVERLESLPVVVVVSTGQIGHRRWPEALKEVARHRLTMSCRLEPLGPEATSRRIRDMWIPDAAGSLCWAVHRASGGIPFLVDVVASELATGQQRDEPTSLPAPQTVAEWALERARRLDERAPAFLSAAAVFASSPELRHAAVLAELDDEEAAELADGLVDLGLLAVGERMAFAQPVVAAALEAARPPGQSATMHLRAAKLLTVEGADPEEVGAHLLRGGRTGSELVVEALRAAAEAALRRGAPADAVRYLRRALEEPPGRRLRARVLLELGRSEATAGEPQAAVRLREAVEYGLDMSEGPRTALQTGRALFALGKPAEAVSVFERGLEQTTDRDAEMLPRLQAARATALWLLGRTGGGGGAGGLPAPPTGDTPGDRALLAVQAIEGAFAGSRRDEVRELAMRALGRGALLEDETADGLTYYLAAGALAIAEDLQAAEISLTAAREDARARGSVLGFATASHVRSAAILMRGRLRDAAADARDALATERHGWRLGLSGARVVLANTHMERGEFEAADRCLAEADTPSWENDPFSVALFSTRGRLRLLSADWDDALADFLACREPADRAGMTNPVIAAWRSGAAHALTMLGDTAEAQRLADEELSLAQAFGAPGPIGRSLRTLGMIRSNGSRLEALQAAAEILEGSQAALERARSLVEYGAALRRSGQRRDARAPLRAGLDLAERCGAQLLVARATQEAKLAGARPRRTALHGLGSLTARERQVATLAAEGLSNRAIAETLVVTVKTVEWHLKHTYRKLGVTSRQRLSELLETSK